MLNGNRALLDNICVFCPMQKMCQPGGAACDIVWPTVTPDTTFTTGPPISMAGTLSLVTQIADIRYTGFHSYHSGQSYKGCSVKVGLM